MAPTMPVDKVSPVVMDETEQASLGPTGGPDAQGASGDRPKTVRERARALQAAGLTPAEIVASLNAEAGRRRYNLGAVLAMLRPQSP